MFYNLHSTRTQAALGLSSPLNSCTVHECQQRAEFARVFVFNYTRQLKQSKQTSIKSIKPSMFSTHERATRARSEERRGKTFRIPSNRHTRKNGVLRHTVCASAVLSMRMMKHLNRLSNQFSVGYRCRWNIKQFSAPFALSMGSIDSAAHARIHLIIFWF